MTPDDWAALAKQLINAVDSPNWAEQWTLWLSAATLLIAVIATVGGLYQLHEAKTSRLQTLRIEREKAQPYVVASMTESAAGPEAIDLVVRNYGQTAAKKVRIVFEPKLTRAHMNADVFLPDEIPLLAPGQEWRTLFDFSQLRVTNDALPSRYEGTVYYEGLDDEKLTSTCILDWAAYKDKTWVQVDGLNELAKSVGEMRNQMKTWTEGINNNGLSVFVRSGDKKDERTRAWIEELRQEEADSSNPSRRVPGGL
ncbi:hypothetical protein AB4Y95_00430 [Arthrobacter sp. M-10]|uniref:hypothetical protein n=1 Tax=Arthrobacter sp. M-10 TaxID=3233037 RepID=UPI003F8E9EBD